MTFPKEEEDVLDALQKFADATMVPQSAVIRDALRATIMNDKESAERLKRMSSFSAAAPLVALDSLIAFA